MNAQRFRGPPVEQPKPPGRFRIMAVGGSITFDGAASSDSTAWPARLESWLRHLGGPGDIEVINAGVPGYILLDNLVRLHTELYQYQPDLILLYLGHNEIFSSLRGQLAPAGKTHLADALPTAGLVPSASRDVR